MRDDAATKDGDVASCQVFEEAAHYSLHGVKVINTQLSSAAAANNKERKITSPAPLVLLHGYANGSLYFYRNLYGLSQFYGQIYALDLLGWGLSSRPSFQLTMQQGRQRRNNSHNAESTNGSNASVKSAEQFFVESLESWRQQHNLPKMTLAGHSMGGYLSVAYAEQYPQHVDKLILLSPVGVPVKSPEEEDNSRRLNSMPFYVRAMIHTVRSMFHHGITPGVFLRSLPHSKSRSMVNSYITNRLPSITCEEERASLSEYLYQNSMLPGSGEYCLNAILDAGAFAKVPLVHRIPEIRRRRQQKQSGDDVDDDNYDDGLEVHFIYGENDWMDYRGGLDVQRLCHQKTLELYRTSQQQNEKQPQQNQTNATNQSPSLLPPKIFVHGVRNAGHLLMLDNYQEFNAAMAIAAGKEDELLPLGVKSRPVEFICNEVAAANDHDNEVNSSLLSRNNNSGKVVMSEQDAAKFFRGARWNRQKESQQQQQQQREEED
jgi:cardiolipin-specific phospholipase